MGAKSYRTTHYTSNRFSELINGFTHYQFDDIAPIQLYPEGHFELILQLESDFLHNTPSTDQWESRPQQFIGGLHNQAYSIRPACKNASLISIVFKPESAKYFIPEKLNAFKNKVVDVADVFTRAELELVKRVDADATLTSSITNLENFLERVFRNKTFSPIDKVLGTITKNKEALSVSELAKSVNLSDAQFRKRFGEEVGMSPKEYQKIIRFDRIAKLLQTTTPVNLTDLAYENGYYDQAHFIHDFRSITGVSPKKYGIAFE
ncbi:MAG: helix-turn-helix transcriptional regulator [Crocinitomicaceae bacterium]|nr:helix-turn-helix transcriptional regulator [Crocinitomicaceae bacterium]